MGHSLLRISDKKLLKWWGTSTKLSLMYALIKPSDYVIGIFEYIEYILEFFDQTPLFGCLYVENP